MNIRKPSFASLLGLEAHVAIGIAFALLVLAALAWKQRDSFTGEQ